MACAFALVALVFVAAPTPAHALTTHDLSTGSLAITTENVDSEGYVVTQTDAATISTSNSITVGDGVTTTITLSGINIDGSDSGISVTDTASLTLVLAKGTSNTIRSSRAGVHVGGGSLTIQGAGSLSAISKYDSAGIGSNYGEDMSGSIVIGSNAKVYAESDDDGAGIGSGGYGNMSGSIHITGNADVEAYSDDEGCGIGAGKDATLSGSVLIDGNATVWAKSKDNGAGIGGGEYAAIASTGTITIGGNAVVTAIGDNQGAGIGAGEGGSMAGVITIQDNATVAAYAGTGAAAIGCQYKWEMTGTIRILDNAKVTTGVDGSTSDVGYIGSTDYSHHDDASGSFVIGSGTAINGIAGSDMDKLADVVNFYMDADGNPQNLSSGINVTVTAGEGGTASPAGTKTFVETTGQMALSATASFGYHFVHWELVSGNATIADATSASTTLAVGATDAEVKAVFAEHTWGAASYEWSGGEPAGSEASCTATRTCTGCSMAENETVSADYAQVTAATCTEAGSGTYTASFSSTWASTQTKDVAIAATGHSFATYVSDGNATCTTDGTKTAKCDWGCGATDTVADEGSALGHDYATEWSSDADSHWHACTRCGDKADEAAHTFTTVIDKAATATEAGSKHDECSICGYAKAAVEIPATGSDTDSSADSSTNSSSTTVLAETGDTTVPFAATAFACALAALAAAGFAAIRKRQVK